MHQEALTDKGKEIFPKLKGFDGFYLAGGTALALQIGHRISVDFDLFSSENISKQLLSKVKKVFPQLQVSISVNNPDELTVFVNEVKVSFIKYPFPVLFDFVDIAGIKTLSVKEIGATKAYTIGRRSSFKDYIDLFFILDGNYSLLDGIIDIAEKKYGAEFNSRLFLEQLIYLEDIEDPEITMLQNKNLNKNSILEFFRQEIRKIKI